MSQDVHLKWSRTKEGGMRVFLSRYGRIIYLDEKEARMVRDGLTKALRKFKKGEDEDVQTLRS